MRRLRPGAKRDRNGRYVESLGVFKGNSGKVPITLENDIRIRTYP